MNANVQLSTTNQPSPWITHLSVPLVADFASHMFIQWEVVCN